MPALHTSHFLFENKPVSLRFLSLVAFIFVAFSMQAWAATYYVNPSGGTTAQCTGMTDAPYPGSGSAQACAWHHPFDALPPTGDGQTNAINIKGGDTLIIDAGSYQMGADWIDNPATGTGASNYSACSQSWPWDCNMQPVPSGTASAPTRILGAGWNTGCAAAPELWGSQRTGQVLNLNGSSNVIVACLEITDHSNCIESYSTTAVACDRSGSYPFGQWASMGISASASSSVTLQDLNIHGLAHYGVLAGGLTNWTVQRVKIIANGWGGWSGDIGSASSDSGTMTFKNIEVGWNGCTENYGNGNGIYACWGQNESGYGDGFGEAQTSGTWLFQDSYFHDNTQDGLDMLYADGTGFVTVDRVKSTGNAGNQVKIAGPSLVQNSILDGNCAQWYPSTIPGSIMESSDNCRALGNALVFGTTPGASMTAQYNSIMSQGDIVVLISGSDANVSLDVYNNLLFGQPDYPRQNQQQSTGVYWDQPPQSYQLNILGNYYYQTKENSNSSCPASNVCATAAPGIVNSTLAAFDPTLVAGSPLINAANASVGTVAVDFFDNPRPVGGAYDIGAVEYQNGGGNGGGGKTPQSSSVSLSAAPNPLSAGQSLTLTATVTGSGGVPTGTVTFSDNGKPLGSVSLANGVASYAAASLAAGTHAISAAYSGDANFSASTGSVSVVVNNTTTTLAPSTTAVTASPSSASTGQSIKFTATVSGGTSGAPTGSVTFSDGSTLLSTVPLAAGAASFTTSSLTAGTHNIAVTYRGDTKFSGSSASVSVTVNGTTTGTSLSPTTTTLTVSPNSITSGQKVTLNATVVGSGAAPTGVVVFGDNNTSLGTVAISNGAATFNVSSLSVGSHTLSANYRGDATHSASQGLITVTVSTTGGTTGGATTSLAASPNPAVAGQTVVLSAKVAGSAPTGSVTFSIDNSVACKSVLLSGSTNTVNASCSVPSLGVGTHVASASYSGDSNNSGSVSANVSVVINAASTGGQGTGVNLNQFGLTGSWYNKATSGQGILFQIMPDAVSPGEGTLFGGWFTYDIAPAGGVEKQRWYSLQGNVSSAEQAADLNIYANTGGNFGTPPITSAVKVGTATLQFSDCQNGTLNFNFTDGSGRSGAIALSRVDENILCTQSGSNQPSTSSYLLSGAWYAPSTSGQGLVFDINPNENLFFAGWYTYSRNGAATGGAASQRWYTLQVTIPSDGPLTLVNVPIYSTSGGIFDTPLSTSTVPVGTVNITPQSCTSASMDYTFTTGENAGLSGTMTLQRVGAAPANCH